MTTHDDWDELVERSLRNELTEPEMERLAFLLDSEPEKRNEFVEAVRWDTRLADVLSDQSVPNAARPASSRPGSRDGSVRLLRSLLVASGVIIAILSLGIYRLRAMAEDRMAEIQKAADFSERSIATVIGLSGALLWTGNQGEIGREIKEGQELSGGTIEGIGPDSWFELKFNDDSRVTISGTSMLTFADQGQKVLRLKEGQLSASVQPQPPGKPMLIHTRVAVLEVLGTRFEVNSSLTSTALHVSEGQVRLKRFSDNGEVDVAARHKLVAEADNELLPIELPEAVHGWRSQVELKSRNYGKWRPASADRPASLKAIPLVPPASPDITLYLAGLPVGDPQGSPVVVTPRSRFIVRGRVQLDTPIYFGIKVSGPDGEFAGKFRGDLANQQPVVRRRKNGDFEEVYPLDQFTLDPSVGHMKSKLAARPENLILTAVWAFTYTPSPSGLEIFEVVLVPPEESATGGIVGPRSNPEGQEAR